MKILQKIFSIILLLVFSNMSIKITDAINIDTNNYINILKKEIILSKYALTKTTNGNKYVLQISNTIEKIKNNKEQLKKLKNKIFELQNKLYTKKEIKKYKKYFLLIDYIQAKINLELYKIKQNDLEIQNNKVKTKLSEIKNSKLSEIDKKKVEDKLINIQLNLLNSANLNFKGLLSEFEKLSNYEEKGNLKIDFNLEHKLIGKIKSEIKLQNYNKKTSNFNSEFSGKLNALINASFKGEKNFKIELSTFMDFVSKDGNIYILLNKLNIIDKSNNQQIAEIFETLKKLAEKNKYIKINNNDTKQVLKTLKLINSSKIFADSKIILEKPLFTAYKKNGNKYSLIPTKYACDKFKELSAKFDPWNGNTCSDSQYQNLLKEITKIGDFYIELGTENKLGFNVYTTIHNDIKSFNSYILFTDKNIEKIYSNLIAEKENEGFELSYIQNKKLAFYLKAGDNIKVDFKSGLTSNNKFSWIDFIYNAKGYKNNINAKLQLKNKNITGGFEYNFNQYAGYDSKTYETKYNRQNISMTLSGRQDYNNNLQTLDINIKGVNIDTEKKFLKANFTKKANNYSVNIESYNKGQTQFKTNIKLENKNISGNTIINNKEGNEYIKITSTGKYDSYYLNLNNKIELTESLTKKFIGTGTIDEKVQANINMLIDSRNNKNNLNFYVDYKEGNKNILNLEIDNKSTINYKKIEIKKPTNTIELNDVINTKY